jgi:hypothetical protein
MISSGFGLAEGHRLGAPSLHLPEKDEPQGDENEQRRPRKESGQHAPVGRFLDLDLDLLRAQVGDQVVVARIVGVEVVTRARGGVVYGLGGADEDLVALDQNSFDLTICDAVEQLGEGNFAAGGVVTPQDLQDQQDPNQDHDPHQNGSNCLVHSIFSSGARPWGRCFWENLCSRRDCSRGGPQPSSLMQRSG